jgi:ribosomal protein S18 acetylase RimI-like enzyme
MPIVVRAASGADFDTLITLNQVVQSLHAALYPSDFKPVVDPAAVRALFATHIDAPESGIGIAEIDRAPVGYVFFEVQARPETGFSPARPRMYVHHLSVAAEARRQGVATALMEYIEQRADSDGINEIVLDVWAANLDAQHFFCSQGFVAFNVVLRKKLAGIS